MVRCSAPGHPSVTRPSIATDTGTIARAPGPGSCRPHQLRRSSSRSAGNHRAERSAERPRLRAARLAQPPRPRFAARPGRSNGAAPTGAVGHACVGNVGDGIRGLSPRGMPGREALPCGWSIRRRRHRPPRCARDRGSDARRAGDRRGQAGRASGVKELPWLARCRRSDPFEPETRGRATSGARVTRDDVASSDVRKTNVIAGLPCADDQEEVPGYGCGRVDMPHPAERILRGHELKRRNTWWHPGGSGSMAVVPSGPE